MHPDAGLAGHPPVQLQLGEFRQQLRQLQAAAQRQLLAALRCRAQQVDQWVRRQGWRDLYCRRSVRPPLQAFEDVLDRFHQHRSLADQLVAATRAGMMDGAGNRIDLAALLCSQPRRDQRPARGAGFHHQGAQ